MFHEERVCSTYSQNIQCLGTWLLLTNYHSLQHVSWSHLKYSVLHTNHAAKPKKKKIGWFPCTVPPIFSGGILLTMWLADACRSPFLLVRTLLSACSAILMIGTPVCIMHNLPDDPSIQVAEIQPGAKHCLTSGRTGDPCLGTVEALNVILTAQNCIQVVTQWSTACQQYIQHMFLMLWITSPLFCWHRYTVAYNQLFVSAKSALKGYIRCLALVSVFLLYCSSLD